MHLQPPHVGTQKALSTLEYNIQWIQIWVFVVMLNVANLTILIIRYVCSDCDKAYQLKQDLRLHMRKHTGQSHR